MEQSLNRMGATKLGASGGLDSLPVQPGNNLGRLPFERMEERSDFGSQSSSSDDDEVDQEVISRLEADPSKTRFARLRSIFLGRAKRHIHAKAQSM